MISLEAIVSGNSAHTETNRFHPHLKNLNLQVAAQDTIAVIGKPKSGKSALLRIINYTDTPATGIEKFDQMRLTVLSKKELLAARVQIGYVNQNRTLLNSKNIFSNIALGLKAKKTTKQDIVNIVNDVMQQVNILDCAPLFPKQLNATQKVLACIARALVLKPKVLILDEITKGLDPKASQIVISALKDIKEKYQLAFVIATNDLEVIKSLCDKVIVLEKGEVIEQNFTKNFFIEPESTMGRELIKAKARLELPISIRTKLKEEKSVKQAKRKGTFDTPEKQNSNENIKQNQLTMASDSDTSPTSLIARCVFSQNIGTEFVFSEIIEKLNNKVNIISGHQEVLGNTNLNVMFVELSSFKRNVNKAISFLNENEIYTEVLGYVS